MLLLRSKSHIEELIEHHLELTWSLKKVKHCLVFFFYSGPLKKFYSCSNHYCLGLPLLPI